MDLINAQIAKLAPDTSGKRWRTKLPKPEAVAFDPSKTYAVVAKTNKGTVKIRLMPDHAPMHVTSFLYLTRLGFYDDLAFHRVITGFMAQGGCPLGTGTGGPGYQFDGEFEGGPKHDRKGLLSMANAGPGTDGSQFFLTFVPTAWLDDNHTVFGEVVEGLDVLEALEACGSRDGKTTEPLKMEKVTAIVE